ncbi:hypothetical protein [Dolichospermum sp. UHCC 0259]|uniref:hypothetical protein n=1 Tax=Dolichospermum sp. UHCC 0259 TaxID=2590010 RepID=UPI0014489773|nr:hypothetical protein [Dolichospermum sp. UHCC 0259]MTJ48269.1 hypothetical protein [Dolichospermum sp. UHCC 0259]
MTVKQLIQAEIDNIPEEKLDEVYQLLKEFIDKTHSEKKEILSIHRSILDNQYQIISQKITQQFDTKWLETLETEDDLLQAAVEITKSEKNVSNSYPYHDLDYLAGTWGEEDETEFLANTKQFKEIEK